VILITCEALSPADLVEMEYMRAWQTSMSCLRSELFMTHPGGQHAFDILDDVARSHEIIKRTIEFLKTSLISSSSSRV
jgi:hypothetical protein